MNLVVAEAIRFLANILLGIVNFERILATVERWADKEIASAEKREGVIAELSVIGIELSESLCRAGVELAVQYRKKMVG